MYPDLTDFENLNIGLNDSKFDIYIIVKQNYLMKSNSIIRVFFLILQLFVMHHEQVHQLFHDKRLETCEPCFNKLLAIDAPFIRACPGNANSGAINEPIALTGALFNKLTLFINK
jgi:hypothetical protein